EIVDHGHLEESRFVDQVVQPSRFVGRHVVEIKVHRQIPAHESPGPAKVDHCHLYFPPKCGSLPDNPRKCRAMTRTEIRSLKFYSSMMTRWEKREALVRLRPVPPVSLLTLLFSWIRRLKFKHKVKQTHVYMR